MGKINNAFTHYFRNPRRFADLYNGIFFQGDAVIAPQQLKDASEVYHEAEAEKVQCAEDDGKITMTSHINIWTPIPWR